MSSQMPYNPFPQQQPPQQPPYWQPPPMRPSFDFGWVISKAFSVFFRYPSFLVMGALIFAPLIIFGLLSDYPGMQFHGALGPLEQTKWFLLATTACGWLLQPLLAGTVIYATVEDLSGRRPSLGKSLSVGVSRMLPTMLVSMLVGLLVVLGVFGVIVGAYIVMCMLYVAVPASVIERPGIWGAIKRSAELTAGYRWWIFLLLIVVGAIVGLGGTLLDFVIVKHEEVGVGVRLVAASSWGTYKCLHIILAIVGGTLGATVQACAYVSLRAAKDGVGAVELAKVFD